MASNEAAILIKLLADKSNLDVTLKDAEGSVVNFDKKVKGLAGQMAGALGGMFAGIAIGKVLMDGVMGANELATGLGRLQVVINNFNPGMKATTEEIKAWTEATAVGTKFTHDELMPALEKAVVKVKDYATAQQIVKDAIKLSTLANIPLEEATNQLSLAHEGFSRGLMMTARQIGLNVKEGTNYNDIINKINEGYAGMAAVIEGDLTVAIKKAKDEMGDLLEERFVPMIPTIITGIKKIVEVVSDFTNIMELSFVVIMARSQFAWTAIGNSFKGAFAEMKLYFTKFVGGLITDLQIFWEKLQLQYDKIKGNEEGVAEHSNNIKQIRIKGIKDVLAAQENSNKYANAYAEAEVLRDNTIAEAEKEVAKRYAATNAAREGKGKPPKKPGKLGDEEAKAEEDFTKMRQKADKARLAEQEKMLAQSLKDNETYNKALEDADRQTQLAIMENWNKRLAKINEYLSQAASSLADVTTAWLNGEKDAWKNWADDLIKQIERVILKKLFLMALDTAFGGGTGILGSIMDVFTGVSKAAGFGGSPGGSPQIQIITADLGTTVRFINKAYGNATPKAQAQLYRNVQRGQLNDYNR